MPATLHELLDQQVAARIAVECVDGVPVEAFQRAAYIAEELLAGLGFQETTKALRQKRCAVGLIDKVARPAASVSPETSPQLDRLFPEPAGFSAAPPAAIPPNEPEPIAPARRPRRTKARD